MKRVYRLTTDFVYIATSSEGAVLVNSSTSSVYELSGYFILLIKLMDKWRTEDELAQALATEYGGPSLKLKDAVSKFTTQLSDVEALETKRTIRRPARRLSSTPTKKKLAGRLKLKDARLSQDQLMVAGYCIDDTMCPPGYSCAIMADICLQYCYAT